MCGVNFDGNVRLRQDVLKSTLVPRRGELSRPTLEYTMTERSSMSPASDESNVPSGTELPLARTIQNPTTKKVTSEVRTLTEKNFLQTGIVPASPTRTRTRRRSIRLSYRSFTELIPSKIRNQYSHGDVKTDRRRNLMSRAL